MNREQLKDLYVHHMNVARSGHSEFAIFIASILSTNSIANWLEISKDNWPFLFIGIFVFLWGLGIVLFKTKMVARYNSWYTTNNPDFDKIFECFWMVYQKIEEKGIEEKTDGSK